MPPEDLGSRFPWAEKFRRKREKFSHEAPLVGRCLPGVLEVESLSSSFPFPLLSETISAMFLSLFFSFSVLLSPLSRFLTFALYTFLPRTFSPSRFNAPIRETRLLGSSSSLLYMYTHIHSFSFLLLRGFLRSFSGYLSFLCSGSPFYHLAEQQLVAQRGLSKGIKDLPIVLRKLRRTPSLVSKQTRSNNRPTKIDVFPNRWENTCTF